MNRYAARSTVGGFLDRGSPRGATGGANLDLDVHAACISGGVEGQGSDHDIAFLRLSSSILTFFFFFVSESVIVDLG